MKNLKIISVCFLCLDTFPNEMVNVHRHFEAKHLVHRQCLEDYRRNAGKELNFCPVCSSSTKFRHQRLRIDMKKFSKPLCSVEDCNELFKTFDDSEYSFGEVLITLYSFDTNLKLPPKNTHFDLITKEYIYERLFQQTIQDLKKLESYELPPLANFAARFDDDSTFLLALTLLKEKRSEYYVFSHRILFFSFQSLELFEKITTIWSVSLPEEYRFQFYSTNSRPHRKVIETLDGKRYNFFKNRWVKLKLLEEALQYDYLDGWFLWIKIIGGIHSISLKKFRVCLMIATVKDYVPVFEWVQTKWNFNYKTAVAYYKFACISDSPGIKMFLEIIYFCKKDQITSAEKETFEKLVRAVKAHRLVGTWKGLFPLYVPKDLTPIC